MTERVLVWGAGGHGRVVADLARSVGHEIVGYADRDAARLGQLADAAGGAVVCSEDDLTHALDGESALPGGATVVALGMGDNTARLRALRRAGALCAAALVHPRATVSAGAILGRGTVVMAGAVVNTGATVGAGVVLNSACVVEHDCQLGDGVHVSPGAVLTGGVLVGSGAWIGAGAVVLPTVVIGPQVIIGAAALVRSGAPHGIYAGVPARFLRDLPSS